MQSEMRVLGIETSCDETGIAIFDASLGLLAHVLYSQVKIHAEYGGVVPELASRDHIAKILPLIQTVLTKANLQAKDISGVAYTGGPGLLGALLVGACVGRALAYSLNVPAIPINHLEGHILAPMLEESKPCFPFLTLLVSGGHTQIIKVIKAGHYEILGETLDDAVGEAFDKTAKLLGLGYPGGARLEALAKKGNPLRFNFPRPMLDKKSLDMSFSGLKTHVAQVINQVSLQDEQMRADIACAFQEAVIATLTIKSQRAIEKTGYKALVVAGGVAANYALRLSLQQMMEQRGGTVYFPRQEFCTDNGAMIAYVGCQRLLRTKMQAFDMHIYPRWSLSDLPPF